MTAIISAWSSSLENVKQDFLHSHSLQDDHKGFMENIKVRLTDKTQGSDSTKQEYCWMRTLKTLYPDNLNTESNYQLPLCSLGYVKSLPMLIFSWEPK